MRGSESVITSRPSSEMAVSSVLITGARLRFDNSRTKWTFAVSVRNVRRIRNVESSNVAVGGLCLFRVLSSFRSKCLRKGIENIKKTSARRFVTRRVSSRRSRSRRLDFLDDLSSIYLGDRYVFLASLVICLRISHLRIICLPFAS